MHLTLTISAGQRIEFSEQADFFRMMAGTGSVTVQYYKNGAMVAEGTNVQVGYAERFTTDSFDRFAITNTSGFSQTITIATRLGNEVHYDTPPNGAVTVTNVNGAFTQSQKTVTNASGQLAAANGTRRYLLIQNNDASGIVYVKLDGSTATSASGIAIQAGGSIELSNFVPTGAITAIGSIASNANVVLVEA